MARGSRENSLVRAVARWVKGWAESVLKEPDAPVVRPVDGARSLGETAGASVSAPASSQEEEGGPPEHWLQLVRSKRPGPPEHWLQLVRQGAPHLLEGLTLEDAGPEKPGVPPVAESPRPPVAPIGPPRKETVPVTRAVPAPQARLQARPRIAEGGAAPSEPHRAPAPSL